MIKWLLLPLTFVYGSIIYFRNKLFDLKIIPSKTFKIPVIAVGNITVGGTGKTPHIEFLVEILKDKYHLAVLSRGYKRTTKGFVEVTTNSNTQQVGDEPMQIKHKFPAIRVVVDEKRVHGIETLLLSDNKPELVLLDDAYQHRKVKAGLNIVLIDYNRPIDKDIMLPAGRLREPMTNIKRANIVIVTKCPDLMDSSFDQVFRKRFRLMPNQALYFTTFNYGVLQPVFQSQHPKPVIDSISGKKVLTVTGIAQPERLYQFLSSTGAILHKMQFPDHHHFTANNIQLIATEFEKIEGSDKIIICTEKDAVRLVSLTENYIFKQLPIYYLPIIVKFTDRQEHQFIQQIEHFTENY